MPEPSCKSAFKSKQNTSNNSIKLPIIDTHRSILKASTERSKNTNTNRSKKDIGNNPSLESFDLQSKHKEGSSENVLKNHRPKCKRVGFVEVSKSTWLSNKPKFGDGSSKTPESEMPTKKTKENHFISRSDELATTDDISKNPKQRLPQNRTKDQREGNKKLSTDDPVLLKGTPRLVTSRNSNRPLLQVEEQTRPLPRHQDNHALLHTETFNFEQNIVNYTDRHNGKRQNLKAPAETKGKGQIGIDPKSKDAISRRSPETLLFMRKLERVFNEGYSDDEQLFEDIATYNPLTNGDASAGHLDNSLLEGMPQHTGSGGDIPIVGDVGLNKEWAGLMNAVEREVGEDLNVSHNPTKPVKTDYETNQTATCTSTESMYTISEEKDVLSLDVPTYEAEEIVEEIDFDVDIKTGSYYDLDKFRFDLLTKPVEEELTQNQQDYKRYCGFENIIPNAFILRSLDTGAMILQSQQMGPRGIKALCCALSTNIMCVELEVAEDDINPKTMTMICEMLIENDHLTSVDLSDNRMGRVPVRQLMEALQIIDRVVSLNLSGNCLTDSDADIFVEYLNDTTILKDLDLSYNGFRNDAGTLLGKCFARNASLENVSLRWNHLNFGGGMGLIKGLEGNSTIKFLDLAWNGLGEEGVRNLSRMLKKNSTLEELDISANRINMTSMLSLLAAIKKNTSLRDLHMGENVLSSGDIHELLNTLLTTKGELSIKNMNLGRCTINRPTVQLVERMIDERDIMIIHGAVYGEKEKTDSEELACLNPVTVLLEFGRLLDMTLEELFDYIDEDGGGTLDRDEIRDGMNAFDIPLPERSLDILIRKMDSDGDGEIALSDLQSAENSDERNRIKDKMTARSMTVSNPETEMIRCRKILARLLAENEKKREALQAAEDAAAAAEAAEEEEVVAVEEEDDF